MAVSNLIEAFTPGFLSTLIGLLIGIPIALWVDRRITSTRSSTESKKTLEALRDEIDRNIVLLKQIDRELRVDTVIYYNLQLSSWKTVSVDKLSDDIDTILIRKISRIYYEFEHFSRKIDTQFEMYYGTIRSLTGYVELRKMLIKSIHLHLVRLLPECRMLTTEIRENLASF